VRLLSQDADNVEARIYLAGLQMNAKSPEEALATLQSVQKVSQENAPKLFRVWAYAQVQTGNIDAARTTIKRWLETAQTSEDREEAGRLQKYLESLRSGEKIEVAFRAVDPGDSPPQLVRRGETVETVPGSQQLRPNWQTAAGSFVRLDCEGEKATVVLHAGDGDQMFLIDNPKSILIDGENGRTVDLTCGPQRLTPIRIDFEAPGEGKAGIAGIVRAIHFGQ
jgi:hypothetical protein